VKFDNNKKISSNQERQKIMTIDQMLDK